MNKNLLSHIDILIEKYRKEHKGEPPLYIVLSPDEIKAVREEIRKRENRPEDSISTYRDIKIAENPSLLNGNMYVSPELPETGS